VRFTQPFANTPIDSTQETLDRGLIQFGPGAMAMEHLRLGGDIVKMAFGIAFGGIVLALALAVGLGSKELVSRSLERQEEKEQEDEKDATRPLSHL